MGGKFELVDDPIWWCIHAVLWEAEMEELWGGEEWVGVEPCG